MMSIGIEPNHGLVYEGNYPYGRAVWPLPIVTPAKIIFDPKAAVEAEKSSEPATSQCRFREDYFDPISRIRRGRFYFAEKTQPLNWFLQPHPALAFEIKSSVGAHIDGSLNTYRGDSVWHKLVKGRHELPLVVLGLDDRFTIWMIVNIEVISTGEELVTLKAHSSFGTLPTIDTHKIPSAHRSQTLESIERFLDEVHRSSPISVIDRARDAASQCLLAHFGLSGSAAKDLRKLAIKLEDERALAAWAASIIARLHARAKPVEQAKREMREIREQDAELATQCLGNILCELGWADWA